ncbi:amidohydrolase family protein [Oceanicaulis sp. MMSF_3324]|uniref:amidohydrolase family protein n=1 Tax=Oceanicaulis sp. MMSF_3324 TaxID=3046702 RepID=UPI00273E7AAD|nr:amidohydrolase family protein [Oceanicaulis sp. MMSF_3324]
MKKLLTSLALAAAVIAPASAQTLVINNGRVVTNTNAGVIQNGAVVVRDGAIVEVGSDVAIPDGAEVIDAEGGWITPGLFHPQTQLGLIEVGAESSTHDDSAEDSSFTAAIDVADGFNPSGTHIDSTRLEGVTRFAVHPTTGSAILAGRGALADATGEPDSLFASRQFMLVDMSQSGGRTAGGSRTAAWTFLRAAIEDARFYPGRFMSHHEGDAIDRYDAAALVSAVRGEIPLIMLMDRAADIRRAIAFADQYPAIRVIIAGGAEAHLVADDLADAGIPVIYDPMRNLPDSFDTLASTNEGASILHEAGVQVAYTTLGSDLYFNPRLLAQHAGIAVAHGADWDDAFRAVTLTPAEIYGVGDRFGALATGYTADVVVWDGDPLEVMSAPTSVIIGGELQSLETRQTRLRDRYADVTDEHQYAYEH